MHLESRFCDKRFQNPFTLLTERTASDKASCTSQPEMENAVIYSLLHAVQNPYDWEIENEIVRFPYNESKCEAYNLYVSNRP